MYAPSEMPALIADFWKSYHELPSVLERQGLKSEQATWFLQSVAGVKSNSGYVWNRMLLNVYQWFACWDLWNWIILFVSFVTL
jgi:hypothetical protein